jgi:hypothetical protein
MLLITVAGAAAAWVIVRIANNNTFISIVNGSGEAYASLQQSILKN